jgi:hypothetical protein
VWIERFINFQEIEIRKRAWDMEVPAGGFAKAVRVWQWEKARSSFIVV